MPDFFNAPQKYVLIHFFFFPFAYENKFSMRSGEKEKAPSTIVEGAFIRVTSLGFKPKTSTAVM